MRKFLISSMVLLIAGTSFASATSTAGIVDQPVPLRLNFSTFSGKSKLRVAKKLKVFFTCSKNCGVRINYSLRLPEKTLTGKTSGALAANRKSPLVLTLNSVAKASLSSNFRTTKFTVRVAAKDLQTGKRVYKVRSFRFYK